MQPQKPLTHTIIDNLDKSFLFILAVYLILQRPTFIEQATAENQTTLNENRSFIFEQTSIIENNKKPESFGT